MRSTNLSTSAGLFMVGQLCHMFKKTRLNLKSFARLFICIGLLPTLGGCISNDVMVAVKTAELQDAKAKKMRGIERIAVVSVNGEFDKLQNKSLKSQLEFDLARVRVGDKPYFELQVADAAQALLSADYDVKTKRRGYNKKSKECIQREVRNFDDPYAGNQRKVCAAWRDKSTFCSNDVAIVTFSPKIVSATDGSVLFEKTYSTRRGSKSCVGEKDSVPANIPTLAANIPTLASNGYYQLLQQFVKDITPHHVKVLLPLIKQDNTKNTEKERLLDKAVTLTKKGMFVQACQMMLKQHKAFAQSPAVLYNTGVCWQVRGDLESALDYYKKAAVFSSALTEKDRAKIESAIQTL